MGLLKKKQGSVNTTTNDFDLNDMGVMPTMKRQVLGNGMILGLEQNSVWLYGKVPTAPVANARDAQRRMEAYRPLFETLNQIAEETPRAAMKRRSVTKNSYRNIHLLRTNVPKTWHADVVAPRDRRAGQDTLNQWLNSSLPETTVKESILTLGVQLVPSTTSTGFRGAMDSVTFTLLEGGTPLADFERDLEKVKRIFDRTGVTSLSGSEVASLDSWWNPGRNPDVVTLDHPDHLHVIRDKRTTRTIKKLEEDGVDCEDWPAEIRESADQQSGQAVVSFGSISDLKLNFVDPVEDPHLANWAIPLLGAGALAVSIRGAIEPAEITREELRRNKRHYKNDIAERVKNNKMERQEQEEKVDLLGQVEGVYANSRGTPTLISASGLVAFDGKVEDWDTVVRSAAEMQAMEHRQSKAWAEMMICSMRNANPNLMDMPIQNLACAGLNDVSKIGDKFGVMRGFTELDKQPAYYNLEEAYGVEDSSPISTVIGASGSGKSVALTTIIKTPGQSVMMGDLAVGDTVLGRDGKPCTVLSVHDEPEPEMFKITLSDGQVIFADAQHQWVVSDFNDRQRPRKTKHLAAQENRRTLKHQIGELKALAEQTGDELVDHRELAQMIAEHTTLERWSSARGTQAAMRMADVPARGTRHDEVTMTVDGFTQHNYATVYDSETLLEAVISGSSARLEEHRQIVETWQRAAQTVADQFTDQTVTVREVSGELVAAGCGMAQGTLKYSLPKIMSERGVASDGAKPPKAPKFPTGDFFDALVEYEPGLRGHPIRHDVIAAAKSLRTGLPQPSVHPRKMAEWLVGAGAEMDIKDLGGHIARWAKAAGLDGQRTKVPALHGERIRHGRAGQPTHLYRADEALGLLAVRLGQIMGDRGIAIDTREKVLSTEEMIAEGLTAPNAGSNFAIHLADPIVGTERELPIDPYVFGAWLGDGSHSSGSFASPDSFVLDEIEAAGFEVKRGSMDKASDPQTWYEHFINGLAPLLRAAGTFGEKHIPWQYQTASQQQRIAVLQGLMDTDGTIDVNGSCELSLSDERLADDALDLIRSLGIKASKTVAASGYRDQSGNYVRTKDRHRIHFTTDQPVFRLPRKAQRLPNSGQLRETQKWLYIESIEPAPAEPARCITVDSPDSTYLIEGFIPTHNTLLMQWEMFQTNLLDYPQIVVDPKARSDLSPVVEAMPNGRVYSLDELAEHDGIFDAVKYSPNPDVAVDFALATITALNPYGSAVDMAQAEPDLITALRYGMDKGHRSTLTALKRAVRDGKLDQHHVTQIEKLSTSSPMFSALVGHSDEGEGLGTYEGTTLIKVGDQELNLPDPGSPPSGIIQRVNLALVRNIVFASAMALNQRKGVLRLDEAWVFTSNSPKELERLGRLARSQTIDVQLYTQRISDALDANLQNYLTRGLILHMRDPVEAKAACSVFNLEPTPERLGRIQASGTLDNEAASPDWSSLKALKDPVTREVIRGSVGLYIDIHGRVVPVEIRVPPRFLKLASTNIDDIEAREREADELDRARQEAEQTPVPTGG